MTSSTQQSKVLTDNTAIADFCRRQGGADFITVDTEFLRERTYWPQLCLVQIAGPEEVVAIDALAEDVDLTPLFDLLADPDVLKVFHAARQDIEIFYRLSGRIPAPLFDTQVAAMVCGFGDSVGYETLAIKLAKAKIDKSSRFTDWSHRPLTARQIDYALSDVTHLRLIYECLAERLAAEGRAHWVEEEMATLCDPKTYQIEPADAWRRLKARSTNPRFLAVVRALAAWREELAQSKDIPRNRILRDEAVLDIAAQMPTSIDELRRSRGLPKGVAEGRQGTQMLEVVAQALALPEAALPAPPERADLPNGYGPVVDLLKVLLKMRCEDNNVAQRLVASQFDLEVIATTEDDPATIPALRGWRREVFGEDALALRDGSLVLGIRGKKLLVLRLGEDDRIEQPTTATRSTRRTRTRSGRSRKKNATDPGPAGSDQADSSDNRTRSSEPDLKV